MQVMLMRLMSKGEYLMVPKGTKFTGSGKLGLNLCLKMSEMQLIPCLIGAGQFWPPLFNIHLKRNARRFYSQN